MPAGGRVIELGTGSGVGLAWLVHGLGDRGDVTVTSVDSDADLLGAVRGEAWPPWVDLVEGDGATIVRERAPFDLIFADAPSGKVDGLEHTIAAIAPRGVLVVDDMDTAAHADDGLLDAITAVREQLSSDPRLLTVELELVERHRHGDAQGCVMDDADARRRFGDARVARLATTRADGRPHIVPLCFALDGDTFGVGGRRQAEALPDLLRLANVRAHDQVSLLVDHYDDDWTSLWWVRLDGVAEVVVGGTGHAAAIETLAAKYPQYQSTPPSGAVLRVTVTGLAHWEAGRI